MKKPLRWDPEKSKLLKATRGVSFEDMKKAIDSGGLLDTIDHPNRIRYSDQKIYVVEIDKYVHLSPFIEDEEKIFMKTIYRSRKMTKKYLGRRKK